jgi:hypothetical protein
MYEMELCLERSELAILVLHMNIMRKPIKRGFKSNYGHFEGRKKLKEYDELKEMFMNELQENNDPVTFDLNNLELNMLQSFLNWYVLEIKISAETQGANVEKDEQIVILDDINKKVNVLVQAAAENLLNQTV